MPALSGDDIAAVVAPGGRPRLDLADRLAHDPLLDRLPLAVQRLELLGELPGLGRILSEQQLQRRLGPAQASGGVDPRREPEADRTLVERGRIHAGDAQQRAQARLLRLREAAQTDERERTVLVDERHDVGDRRERHDVEMPLEERVVGAEQPLGQLPHHRGPTETGKGIIALERGDHRTCRERLRRAVVVGDDDLEPETAVMPQSTVTTRSNPSSASRVSVCALRPYPSSKRDGRCHDTSAPSSRKRRTPSAVAQMPSAS